MRRNISYNVQIPAGKNELFSVLSFIKYYCRHFLANIREIERQKTMIRTQLDKRKQFKTKVTQTDKISVLNETLTMYAK